MSLVSLVNLAKRLLNHDVAQGQDTNTAQKSTNTRGTQAAQAAHEDQFTP